MSLTLGPIVNNQNRKVREWSIKIELFAEDDKPVAIPANIDAADIKEGYYAAYTTCSGYAGMKMNTSAPTVIRTGKNLGKKNETNVLTQAYKECQSKFASKIKSGYTDVFAIDNPLSAMPFPQAVKSWKNHKAKLQYPLFVQPKLDGVRMLARLEVTDGEDHVRLYTRRLHDIVGFGTVKNALDEMFRSSQMKTFIVDGELYSHGTNLQTISGIVRNESIDEIKKEMLQFHVFDIFDVNQPALTFDERHKLLKRFVNSNPSSCVVLTPTHLVKDAKEADALYNQYVKQKYEGIIYKSYDSPYEFDFHKEKRSTWYQKRKKQDDAEFRIIGFTEGKGKDRECIVFELQGPNNKTFNSVPNGTYAYRKELYHQAVKAFDTVFKDRLAKVVYDDLSKDGVPLRGRIVQIGRDLSFD